MVFSIIDGDAMSGAGKMALDIGIRSCSVRVVRIPAVFSHKIKPISQQGLLDTVVELL